MPLTKHPNDYARAQFILGELEPAMDERRRGAESYGSVAQRDLARYYELLRRTLERLPSFTEGEASLIVDACNGWFVEPHTAPLLWAQVDDAIRDEGLDQKWGVDGAAVVTLLRALSPWESLAVCDAAERAWRLLSAGDDIPPTLRAVGLVR
jgi:hypothetical protein